jgi:rifampin ADP-ribosylating transferase
MDFNPNNPVIKLCVQAMDMEAAGNPEEAKRLFIQAWNEATDDFEKFTASYYVARHQPTVSDSLKWYEASLQCAINTNSDTVKSAFPSLHNHIAKCYEALGNLEKAKEHRDKAASFTDNPSDRGPFYHGTRADLQVGDLLTPGNRSNYKSDLAMNHIYFTALVNGAGLAAALASGDGRERVYIVEPTEGFENDPNVTDKKFPGNPTRSYRTTAPLKIVGEATEWIRQTPEQIQHWRERLASSKGEIIN